MLILLLFLETVKGGADGAEFIKEELPTEMSQTYLLMGIVGGAAVVGCGIPPLCGAPLHKSLWYARSLETFQKGQIRCLTGRNIKHVV